ncbi:MAG: glycoside hydrolase family 26 protein [Treponema sp.]|nr:glycoside hydrolase family 26 protein [Treponema sp.]
MKKNSWRILGLIVSVVFLPACMLGVEEPVGSMCLSARGLGTNTFVGGQRVLVDASGDDSNPNVYVLGARVCGSGDTFLSVVFHDTTRSYGWMDYRVSLPLDAGQEWRDFETEFSYGEVEYHQQYSPGQAITDAMISIGGQGRVSKGDIYIDRIWFYRKDDPDKTNLLKNANFSDANAIERRIDNYGQNVIRKDHGLGKLGVWYLNWGMDPILKSDIPLLLEKGAAYVESNRRPKMPYFGPEPPLPPQSPGDNWKNIGVYLWDRNAAGADGFQEWLGGLPVNYAEDFADRWAWGEWKSNYRVEPWRAWKNKDPQNRRFVYTVPPFPDSADGLPGSGVGWGGTQALHNNLAYQKAANGDYNSHYRDLGSMLVSQGFPDAIIRFGHEMDGDWYAWSVCAGYNQEEKQENFAKAFRQFVDTMRSVPGQQFEFSWNPCLGQSTPEVLRRSFPGSEYVDYITFDSYDHYYPEIYDHKYQYSSNAEERRRAQEMQWIVFENRPTGLKWFAGFAGEMNRPLAIAEWGLWHSPAELRDGSDNPYFIRKMYNWINENNVAWHLYFMFGDVSHSLYDLYRYPNASGEFLNLWRLGGAPEGYPYAQEQDHLAPRVVPAAFSPDKIPELDGKTPVKELLAKDGMITGSTWLTSDPWAYAGGILGSLESKSVPDSHLKPTAITFRDSPGAKHLVIVYQLWRQNWDQSTVGMQFGLYLNGVRIKTVRTQVGGRGWWDSYGYVVYQNMDIPPGAEIRFQVDQEDVNPNNRQGTPEWTPINIDYALLYND